MNDDELSRLQDHYDHTDLTAEIERAQSDPDTTSDPMIVMSIRLPKSLLDWLRSEAERERTRPSALIRQWIEDRQDDRAPDDDAVARLTDRVERLESVTLSLARDDDARDSMTDLLTALQASVDAARGSGAPRTRRSPAADDERHRRGA